MKNLDLINFYIFSNISNLILCRKELYSAIAQEYEIYYETKEIN